MKSDRLFVQNQLMVIYSHAILVAVMSECRVKRVICKTLTGTLTNSADPDQMLQNAALIRVGTVCLNYRKLRIKSNSSKSQFGTIIPAYTWRHSIHQCLQCFDFWCLSRKSPTLKGKYLFPRWSTIKMITVSHTIFTLKYLDKLAEQIV